MPALYAANALWWAYRAGATISRAILNTVAAHHDTTLEAAYEQAKFRRSRGQISKGEMDLINFVMFNDRFRWTDGRQFALDTSAFATAGLGLIAKAGLGNRILAVLGVKGAPTAGVLIDGIIDAVGGMLTGGKVGIPGVGDILQGALEVLRGVQQTDAVKHGTNVVNATVKLGEAIQPFLGGPSLPQAILSVPTIVNAGVNLLNSLLGLWGVVEELLPEPKTRPTTGMRGDPPMTDPVFRNALAAMKEDPPPPPPPAEDPVEIILPGPGPGPDWPSLERRPGDPPLRIIDPRRVIPRIDAETRRMFVRRFGNGVGSLRALKDRREATTFPFG